jgi:hypothetical protein
MPVEQQGRFVVFDGPSFAATETSVYAVASYQMSTLNTDAG